MAGTASTPVSPVSSGSSVLNVSEEKTNGTKLIRLLVDGGTHVLRNLLHSVYPTDKLQVVLNNNKVKLRLLRSKGVIFKNQWEMLFPALGDSPDSKTFDISLYISCFVKFAILRRLQPAGTTCLQKMIIVSEQTLPASNVSEMSCVTASLPKFQTLNSRTSGTR